MSGTPSATIAGLSPTVAEGSSYNVSLSTSNLPAGTSVIQWSINWGDGGATPDIQTIPGNPSTASHVYADGPSSDTVTGVVTLSNNTTITANVTSASVVQDGSLDSTFGSGGTVTSSAATGSRGVVVLTNGNVVQLGQIGNNFVLAGFNASGNVDPAFSSGAVSGMGAKLLLQTIPDPANPTTGTVQRLLVIGNTPGSQPQVAVWRFNLNGTPDASFSGGEVILPPSLGPSFPAANDTAVDATFDSNGNIVIVAQARHSSGDSFNQIAVMRLTPSGQLDTTFNGTGEQTNFLNNIVGDTFANSNNAVAVVTGPDNSVYALAYGSLPVNTEGTQDYLMAFTSSGAVGPIQPLHQPTISFNSMTLDGTGKLLLVGSTNNGQSVAVGRYNLDGTPDLFGTGGVVTYALDSSNSFAIGNSIATTPDGKIIIAGQIGAFLTSFGPNDVSNEFVARLNSNGSLDTTFASPSGVERINFTAHDSAREIVVQANGQIMVAGDSFDTTSFLTLARLGALQPGNATPVNVSVTNVAPAAGAITSQSKAVRGQVVTFSDTFTDPGILDTHTVTWNFGDGSPAVTSSLGAGVTGAVSASHAFTNTGSFTVKLTITDKDGGTVTVTKSVTIDVADIQVDPTNASKTALFVGGTSGNDVISVEPVCDSNSLKVTINGASSTFTPTGRVIVYGNAGNDCITVDEIEIPAELYGGDGNDSIHGGESSNIEVGGAGDDFLEGGNSRDILIGGGGGDILDGEGGDDVLIAMSTVYDANPAALESIQKEWTRTDASFSQRVAHLTGGGGFNGTNVITVATTFNDNSTDLILGDGGSDVSFISKGDIVVDASRSDDVIKLS